MMSFIQSFVNIPAAGTLAESLNGGVARFLNSHQGLELGDLGGYHVERQRHAEIFFALKRLPKRKVNPIGTVEFTTIRGPMETSRSGSCIQKQAET